MHHRNLFPALTRVALAAAVALPASALAAPTIDELGNIAYSGIYEQPATLKGGAYEGKPFAEGGASRPRIGLVKELYATGDIDGDGAEDAWVLLWENSGGTGEFIYLAAVLSKDGKLENAGTVELGDRVDVISLQAEGNRAAMEFVTQGPGDGACCPSLVVAAKYGLQDGKLVQLSKEEKGKLSVDMLAGEPWRLVGFSRSDGVPEGVEITAKFEDGRISGSADCNSYQANFEAPTPYEVKVGPVITTRRACPEPQMDAETRFLKALEGATQFGFMAGRLVLDYQQGESVSSLVFTR